MLPLGVQAAVDRSPRAESLRRRSLVAVRRHDGGDRGRPGAGGHFGGSGRYDLGPAPRGRQQVCIAVGMAENVVAKHALAGIYSH